MVTLKSLMMFQNTQKQKFLNQLEKLLRPLQDSPLLLDKKDLQILNVTQEVFYF